MDLAVKSFEQGVESDPRFAGNYCGLSVAQLRTATVYGLRTVQEAQQLAEPIARRAVALDATDAEARTSLSHALWARGDLTGAQAEA